MEEAAAVGNLDAVERLLPSLLLSLDPTIPLHERAAPGASTVLDRSIRSAAANGYSDITRFFIAKGAVIDDGLICAVLNSGSIEQCKILLNHGWHVNRSYISASGDFHFWTPLRAALGNPSLCLWYVSLPDSGWCRRQFIEYKGYSRTAPTPIFQKTVSRQSVRIDPSRRSQSTGTTPIIPRDLTSATMVAVRLHSPEVVKLLIDYGADPKTQMLLHATASASSRAIAEMYPDREDPDRIGVMQILLDHGADVNEMEPDPKARPRDDLRRRRTIDTGTPLHYAIAADNAIAVSFLLAHGADPKIPSWSGHTALQAAEVLDLRYIAHMVSFGLSLRDLCTHLFLVGSVLAVHIPNLFVSNPGVL
ncbi:ankyrin repeat-containing domain protein [Xylariaceae sp. FL1272]|nr:ankyrin repeat-containing domain protein [Xylariaceae sp. FL1272]